MVFRAQVSVAREGGSVAGMSRAQRLSRRSVDVLAQLSGGIQAETLYAAPDLVRAPTAPGYIRTLFRYSPMLMGPQCLVFQDDKFKSICEYGSASQQKAACKVLLFLLDQGLCLRRAADQVGFMEGDRQLEQAEMEDRLRETVAEVRLVVNSEPRRVGSSERLRETVTEVRRVVSSEPRRVGSLEQFLRSYSAHLNFRGFAPRAVQLYSSALRDWAEEGCGGRRGVNLLRYHGATGARDAQVREGSVLFIALNQLVIFMAASCESRPRSRTPRRT